MTSTTFILASTSSPSSIPEAPKLHILPFSLGSNSNPYSTSSAPTSQYFQPRPAPPNFPSIPAGTPISTFRGRTLVGHTLDVPRGYRGLILGTSKRPDQGGLEHRNHVTVSEKSTGKGKGKATDQWPLTPASSVGSVASVQEKDSKRVTRQNTRGQGQVARARPQTRQPPRRPVVKKRYRLDSDDEDSDEGEKVGIVKREEVVKTPLRTPSKRLRRGEMISPVKDPRLPAIVVQAPTPLKAPPVTRTEMLLAEEVEVDRRDDEGRNEVLVKDGEMESPVMGEVVDKEAKIEDGDERNALELDLDVEVKEEIVPSPSTEEDPPSFEVHHKAPLDDDNKVEEDEQVAEVDGSIRILRPISTFENITLWTPDGPLPGFRADELEGKTEVEDGNEDGNDKVRKGWWRSGGAGEGGDEVVRAMGEWLGLVEMLNKPVYLDGLEDEKDEEEDD